MGRLIILLWDSVINSARKANMYSTDTFCLNQIQHNAHISVDYIKEMSTIVLSNLYLFYCNAKIGNNSNFKHVLEVCPWELKNDSEFISMHQKDEFYFKMNYKCLSFICNFTITDNSN